MLFTNIQQNQQRTVKYMQFAKHNSNLPELFKNDVVALNIINQISPKKQLKFQGKQISAYSIRAQSNYYSPKNIVSKNENILIKDFRCNSPSFGNENVRSNIERSERPSFKAQNNLKRFEDGVGQKHGEYSKNRMRKVSQNDIVGYRSPQTQKRMRRQSEVPQIKRQENKGLRSEPFLNEKPLERDAFKARKGSLNIDLNLNSNYKQFNQHQVDQDHEKERRKTAVMKKPKKWDENNNFVMNNPINLNSFTGSDHSKRHQIEIADTHNSSKEVHRKHSDNQNVKKATPSFLALSRHRKSVDPTDFLFQKKISKITYHNFFILKELGQGTFGKVVLARHKETGLLCAIKIMAKAEIIKDNMVEQLIRQLKIQMYVNSPNVVKIFGFFDDFINFYIMMEAVLDNSLQSYLQKCHNLSEFEAAKIMHQICLGVAHLHGQSIIHRDLKPENIMLHEGIIKICDFGWSVHRGSNLRSTFCGTPIYLCPEILVGNQYDESIDIWALGVVFYEVLYKSNPFKITKKEQLVNILNSQIYFPSKVNISDELKDLIKRCLRKKCEDRIKIKDLLNHQFFKKFLSQEEFLRK